MFHLVEMPGVEFHLRMSPTTPRRHRGDRVAVSCTLARGGEAQVESVLSAPDAAELRRRRKAYLTRILSSEEPPDR